MSGLVELTSARASVVVDVEHGGRLSSLRVDGHELLWSDPAVPPTERNPMTWGAYPMAPFAGRVRHGRVRIGDTVHQLRRNLEPHSIHGSVFDRPWQVDDAGATHAELSTDLGEHWPVPGRCRQRVELADDRLDLLLEVRAGEQAFPVSLGWHPWFRTHLDTGEVLRLDATLGRQYLRDDEGLPSGRLVDPLPRPWDDCFTDVTWPVVLRWDGAVTVSIDSDCDHVVIYDEQPHAWCVEPQTAPPDALGGVADVVEPGRPLRATTTWRW